MIDMIDTTDTIKNLDQGTAETGERTDMEETEDTGMGIGIEVPHLKIVIEALGIENGHVAPLNGLSLKITMRERKV